MIYEIQGRIKTDNQGIRTAVTAILPSESDPKFHGGLGAEYVFADTIDSEDGVKVLIFRYVYTLEADREALLNGLKGLSGIITNCEDGSFVIPIGRNHDTDTPTLCNEQAGGLRK